jgi:hypothetical protein
LLTTYLNNKYAKVSGSSISTAFFAGLAANLIEKSKKTKYKADIPPLVYRSLLKILK